MGNDNELFRCDWQPEQPSGSQKSMHDMLENMSEFVEKLIREFSQNYKDDLSVLQREATSLWKKVDGSENPQDNADKARKIENEIWRKLSRLEHFGSLIREEDNFGESEQARANVSFFYPYHDVVSAVRWWIHHDQGPGFFAQQQLTEPNESPPTT